MGARVALTISLCNLCGSLCVSVVKLLGKTLTTEAQRSHREDLPKLLDAFFSNLLGRLAFLLRTRDALPQLCGQGTHMRFLDDVDVIA